jgi:hypothetical protein
MHFAHEQISVIFFLISRTILGGYRNALIHRLAQFAHRRWEPFFRRHYWLKNHLRRIYRSCNGTLPNSQMAADTLRTLHTLYAGDMIRTRRFSLAPDIHTPQGGYVFLTSVTTLI